MTRIVEKHHWANDPFLSRLSTHRDFDGWFSYFTVKDSTPSDLEIAKGVDLQFSHDGSIWSSVEFAESVSFIDFVSFAWDYSTVLERKEPATVIWRAVFND